MGSLLLEGGAEFGGRMSEPDLRAISLAGGPDSLIAVLPTAAAPDQNQEGAGRNALRWFTSLGASQIDVVPVIDKASANDPALADRVRSAGLIYLLGGFPGYLAQTLAGSRVWQAALDAYAGGAVLGGSSAGAMVLCQHLYDPDTKQLAAGLNLLPNACMLPHHNSFGRSWAPRLAQALPRAALIGIDEQTGILNDSGQTWTVYGAGEVTLYHDDAAPKTYARGDQFMIGDDRR